jgi:hypothetical protein
MACFSDDMDVSVAAGKAASMPLGNHVRLSWGWRMLNPLPLPMTLLAAALLCGESWS